MPIVRHRPRNKAAAPLVNQYGVVSEDERSICGIDQLLDLEEESSISWTFEDGGGSNSQLQSHPSLLQKDEPVDPVEITECRIGNEACPYDP